MSQAVWSGAITFGLVSIPVKLYPATEAKDVRFHLYDQRTGRRVRFERVTRGEDGPAFLPEPPSSGVSVDVETRASGATSAPPDLTPRSKPTEEESAEGRPVPREDIVRGYELPSGDLVTVSDEELVSIAPERSRTIEIEEFVSLAQIDPVFFEKSYVVAPVHGSGAEKPYVLLLRAMRAAGMVGIGRFVLRTRPHLVAIRARETSLALETLFFGDEIREVRDQVSGLSGIEISDRELKTAQQLIAALSSEWEPARHGDAYREELLALLRSKTPSAPAPAPVPTRDRGIDDLMAALRESVEAAKRKREAKPASQRAG